MTPRAVERAILGAVDRHTDQLTRQIAAILDQTARNAATVAANGGDASVATYGLAERLTNVLAPKLAALHEVGEGVVTQAVGAMEVKSLDRFQAARETWARDHAAAKVKGVADTTRRIVRRRVERAVRENTPPAVLSRDLRTMLGGKAAKMRAARIARTELHQAANIGQMAEADRQLKQHGRRFVKVWRAVRDNRTRASHRMADGQARPIGEAFTVGGASLMMPGDPMAPPSQTINCRCVFTLVPEKAAEGQGVAVVKRTDRSIIARYGSQDARADISGRVLTIQRGGELSPRSAPKIYEALAREAVSDGRALAAPNTMTATERAAFEALGKRRALSVVADPDLPAGAVAAFPRPPMLLQLASEVDDQLLYRDLIAMLMERADVSA